MVCGDQLAAKSDLELLLGPALVSRALRRAFQGLPCGIRLSYACYIHCRGWGQGLLEEALGHFPGNAPIDMDLEQQGGGASAFITPDHLHRV